MDNREIDGLVAEKVMGWKRESQRQPGESERMFYYPGSDLLMMYAPAYSTDIALAWLVVRHLTDRGVWLHELSNQSENAWRCILAHKSDSGVRHHQSWGAETAPMAICLAALKTVGVEVE